MTNWAWKPEFNVVEIKKYRARKRKRAKKQIDAVQKREEMLKRFGLHKHSSWAAIAEMIAKESGREIPGTKLACKRMVLKYRPDHVSGGRPKRKYKKPLIPAEKFYASTAWRELRFIALRQSGGCCTLCGARASDGVQLHVDHIIPRSKAPHLELDLDNLQILCEDCNIGKSNRDDTDFRTCH